METDTGSGRFSAQDDRLPQPVRHLYVHVPFCHRICPYCSFHKHAAAGHDIPAFFAAILAEARRARDEHPLALETVYFGGGTPTLPSRRVLQDFLREFTRVLDLARVREFTFEANPRTYDREKIDVLLEHGVTRISLGIQAWDEPTLSTLGRDHSPAEGLTAYGILREAGVPRVNIDLMFSIPGQSLDDWRRSLEQTCRLQPDHVSAYNLNYEEDTEFFRRLQSGEFVPDEDADAEFFLLAAEMLEQAGLAQYEVSNYARPGAESLHNEAYWAGADYRGLGPGAFSTVGGRRWKNVADTRLYSLLTPAGGDLRREVESLTPEQVRTERFALLLRTRKGLPRRWLDPAAEERAADLTDRGLAQLTTDSLVLTRRGRLVADSATVHLLG